MSEETKVVWERESDADLVRSLGDVSNSVMYTIENNHEVKKILEKGDPAISKLKAEKLYAETKDGEKLTKESDSPGHPDAKIIAFKDKSNQIMLELDEKSRENLQQHKRSR